MSKSWYWETGMDKPVVCDSICMEVGYTGKVCIRIEAGCKMIRSNCLYGSEEFALKCQQDTLNRRLYNYHVLVFYATTPQDKNPKRCLYIGPTWNKLHTLQEIGGEQFSAWPDQIYGVYATPKTPVEVK